MEKLATPLEAAFSTVSPADPQQGQLEVLEWGKYCSVADGPVIDGAEHGPLGNTPDYPPILRAMGQPDDLGVSSGQFEEESQRLFETIPYGTVLRPIAIGGREYQVLYRVGVRPESGNSGRGRKYSLARYLLDPINTAPPLTLYAHMNPLSGITRAMAADLPPIKTTTHPLNRQSLRPEPFLRQALIYLVSGVPIQVLAGESDFFRLVDELWHALPPDVRPLLSAGWNVAGSAAAKCAVFSSPAPLDRAAVYRSGAWNAPVVTGSSLMPGEMYSHLFFFGANTEVDRLVREWLASPNSHLSPIQLNTLPEFADVGVTSRFRQAGTQLLENAALGSVQSWLEKGAPDLETKVPMIAEKLQRHPELAKLIDHGLSSGVSRTRADRLAVALSQQRSEPDVQTPAPVLRSNRGAFVAAVTKSDERGVLDVLLNAGASADFEDLPTEIDGTISGLLSRTLDQTKAHARLVQQSTTPDVYRRWARQHVIDLAIRFVADPDLAQGGIASLVDLCPPGERHRLLATISNLISGQQPTDDDRTTLEAASQEFVAAFCSLLDDIWNQAQKRSIDSGALLNWAGYLPADRLSHPVLRLMAGSKLRPEEIRNLVAVDSNIPLQLRPRLSEMALYCFHELRDHIIADPVAWEPYTDLWPESIVLALLGRQRRNGSGTEEISAVQIDTQFAPHASVIQKAIEYWFVEQTLEKLRLIDRAAPEIWNWITHLDWPQTEAFHAAEICWCLARKKLYPVSIVRDEGFDQVELAIALARASGEYGQLAAASQLLWAAATKDWQVRLILELFPRTEFVPTTEQLLAVLPMKNWLRSHVDRLDVPSSRVTHFLVAAADLQTMSFPGSGDSGWRDEWEGTALAAAFKDNLSRTANLQEVFQAYDLSLAERGCLCLRYLSMTTRDQVEYTLSRILNEFLFPDARAAGLDARDFREVIRAVKSPDSQRKVRVAHGDRVALLCRTADGSIDMSECLIPLVWCILNRDYHAWLEKYIDRYYTPALPGTQTWGRR